MLTHPSAAVLARYDDIGSIPDEAQAWNISVRGADALARELTKGRKDALLYEQLATLRLDVPLSEKVEDLAWTGARMAELEALCEELRAPDVVQRVR